MHRATPCGTLVETLAIFCCVRVSTFIAQACQLRWCTRGLALGFFTSVVVMWQRVAIPSSLSLSLSLPLSLAPLSCSLSGSISDKHAPPGPHRCIFSQRRDKLDVAFGHAGE